MKILRWPPLVLLCIGLANILVWYGLAFWQWPLLYAVSALVMIAFVAGVVTEEKPWFTMAVLLVPIMFVGSYRHGRPVDWLLSVFVNPLLSPLALYLLSVNCRAAHVHLLVGCGGRKVLPKEVAAQDVRVEF